MASTIDEEERPLGILRMDLEINKSLKNLKELFAGGKNFDDSGGGSSPSTKRTITSKPKRKNSLLVFCPPSASNLYVNDSDDEDGTEDKGLITPAKNSILQTPQRVNEVTWGNNSDGRQDVFHQEYLALSERENKTTTPTRQPLNVFKPDPAGRSPGYNAISTPAIKIKSRSSSVHGLPELVPSTPLQTPENAEKAVLAEYVLKEATRTSRGIFAGTIVDEEKEMSETAKMAPIKTVSRGLNLVEAKTVHGVADESNSAFLAVKYRHGMLFYVRILLLTVLALMAGYRTLGRNHPTVELWISKVQNESTKVSSTAKSRVDAFLTQHDIDIAQSYVQLETTVQMTYNATSSELQRGLEELHMRWTELYQKAKFSVNSTALYETASQILNVTVALETVRSTTQDLNDLMTQTIGKDNIERYQESVAHLQHQIETKYTELRDGIRAIDWAQHYNDLEAKVRTEDVDKCLENMDEAWKKVGIEMTMLGTQTTQLMDDFVLFWTEVIGEDHAKRLHVTWMELQDIIAVLHSQISSYFGMEQKPEIKVTLAVDDAENDVRKGRVVNDKSSKDDSTLTTDTTNAKTEEPGKAAEEDPRLDSTSNHKEGDVVEVLEKPVMVGETTSTPQVSDENAMDVPEEMVSNHALEPVDEMEKVEPMMVDDTTSTPQVSDENAVVVPEEMVSNVTLEPVDEMEKVEEPMMVDDTTSTPQVSDENAMNVPEEMISNVALEPVDEMEKVEEPMMVDATTSTPQVSDENAMDVPEEMVSNVTLEPVDEMEKVEEPMMIDEPTDAPEVPDDAVNANAEDYVEEMVSDVEFEPVDEMEEVEEPVMVDDMPVAPQISYEAIEGRIEDQTPEEMASEEAFEPVVSAEDELEEAEIDDGEHEPKAFSEPEDIQPCDAGNDEFSTATTSNDNSSSQTPPEPILDEAALIDIKLRIENARLLMQETNEDEPKRKFRPFAFLQRFTKKGRNQEET